MAKISDNTRLILIASGIIVVGVGGVVLLSKVKKRFWSKGKLGKGKEKPKAGEYQIAKVGEQGYANIRSTPEIKGYPEWKITATSLFNQVLASQMAATTNKIGVVKSGVIGTVIDDQNDKEGYRWLKVGLSKPIGNYKEGWVREDVVFTENKKI